MSGLSAVLERLARDLDPIGHPWCLVGGIAVSARTEPRFTRDLDVAVAVPGDAAAEKLVHHLLGRGYQMRSLIEQQATGRLATTRLLPPEGLEQGIVADLLFASCGIEPEIAGAAERLEVFAGMSVPVAAVGHLVAMKVLSFDDERRPQDRVDIVSLLAHACAEDVQLAREAVRLIGSRGADRGRDLTALLEAFLASR